MLLNTPNRHKSGLECFGYEATKSLLIVYVDDSKLSAKAELHDALWAEIRKVIDMDLETLDGRFRGCSHERYDTVASRLEGMLDNHPIYHPRPSLGTSPHAKVRGEEVGHTQRQAYTDMYNPDQKVKLAVYKMERFARDCVTVFCDLTGYDKGNAGTAPPPFDDESKDPLVVTQPPPEAAATAAPTGELSQLATKCLMTIMYIARFARQDLLRAVGTLTTIITRWVEMCD